MCVGSIHFPQPCFDCDNLPARGVDGCEVIKCVQQFDLLGLHVQSLRHAEKICAADDPILIEIK